MNIEEEREGNKRNGEFLRKSPRWFSWCPFIVILNSFYQILEIYHFAVVLPLLLFTRLETRANESKLIKSELELLI